MMRKRARVVLGAGVAAFVVATSGISISNAAPTAVPAPAVDEPAGAGSETAVLAGGCFWGVQGLFQHVDGVIAAESGYAGGNRQTANYETVSKGNTGHAESVRITYDPAKVTYGQLLRIFYGVVEDPGQVTSPPVDAQYRSIIFAQDETQKRVAESYIAQLNQAKVFSGPVVTTVAPKAEFFPAERYHQDFMNSNPTQPYIASSEMPKLADLKRAFPDRYRDQPVLMLASS
jgi:peptide-methionine (S)-S-oxide reductase